ncbi:hypothetical protein C0Q70_20879 [Pomacea canaliculata]|uniref:Uncharacterized protein n=1 Tax=Pomacea canaliculata TaxID=400727 RepID=A0A2T7NAX5_POMCA|nr:hypothetical protein C0Q70_20879 [Pomacea canaliculata]
MAKRRGGPEFKKKKEGKKGIKTLGGVIERPRKSGADSSAGQAERGQNKPREATGFLRAGQALHVDAGLPETPAYCRPEHEAFRVGSRAPAL